MKMCSTRNRSISYVFATGMVTLLSYAASAQCPGVRPRFEWHNDGSTIVFSDVTEGYVSSPIWHFGDGDSAYTDTASHTYALAGLHTVILTVFSGGCEFHVSGVVAHGGEADECTSSLSSSFTYEQTSNNQLEFTDMSQGDGSDLAYFWAYGDGTIDLVPDTSHFYTSPGAYDVTHFVATLDSAQQTACVAGRAEHVYVDGNTSTCDSSLFLNLSGSLAGNFASLNADAVFFAQGLIPLDWSWDYGDQSEDTSVGPGANHDYLYPGDYQVCVDVIVVDTAYSDTCFARACTTLVAAAVGMADHKHDPGFSAWPVPFSDELILQGSTLARGEQWLLLDALGRPVIAGVMGNGTSEVIDTHRLAPGLYCIRVGDGKSARSLVIVKR